MRSLYSILVRSYMVLALGPLILLGIMLTLWIASRQIEASYLQEQTTAKHVASALRQHFSVLEDKLYGLNQYRNFAALSNQEMRNVAQEMIARTSSIYSIIILDANGRVKSRVSSSMVYDGSEPLDSTDSELFKRIVKNRQVNYGPVHDYSKSGESLMLVGVPLKDRATDRLEIVLLAEFRLDVVWKNVVEQDYRDGERIFLMAEHGDVLAHPNHSFVLAKRRLSLIDGDRLRKNLEEEWVIGASADLNLGELTYKVVAERDVETALAPAISSAGIALFATLLTAALVFLATMRNVRRIATPVKLLTEAAYNIREEGFYPGVTVSGFKEIKELSLAFDSMTRKLQRMLAELENEVQIRKDSEEALLLSEERFRALHNASFGGIAIHEQGRILDCNQGLAEISGFDVDKLVGMDILQLISETSRSAVLNNIRNEVEDFYEAKAIRKDGVEYPAHLESRNIPYKGRLVQVLEFRDMTSQKRAEEFIIQNEKMMSLGGLAAGMAHEINNPLAAIVGSCQNLRNRLLRDTHTNVKVAEECGTSFENIVSYVQSRDCDNMVESIYESGKRAADIVKDMLSFSRRNEKSLGSNKITDLMDNTIKLVSNDYDLKKNYDFKKIDIVKDYADSNCNVLCYSNQMQQVFFNLLKNAAHAMSDKEYVDDVPRLIIRTYSRDNMNVTEIEDNGPGLSEEARKKVFEPFFSTKGPGKGTGLGLSVSYFIIVKQHRGSMEVLSEPGKWTRFVISIPIEGPENVSGAGGS